MKNGHLSDEIIQEYAWNPKALNADELAHVQVCGFCQQQVADYKLLFSAIAQVPGPEFSFDLEKLVLDQLPVARDLKQSIPAQEAITTQTLTDQGNLKRKNIWPWLAFTLMTFVVIGAPLYLFKDSFQNIIAGLSLMVAYLITITIMLIVAFLVFDEYRKYNKQMNSLDI